MRTGNEQQYLHLASCPRYGILARLFRKVQPWPWAEEQDQPTLLRLTAALDIKHCRTCRPLGVLLRPTKRSRP
jgi:hypothetical protein